MSTLHQLVASEIPSTVTSWETSDDAGTSSVRGSRMRTGSGMAVSAIAGGGGGVGDAGGVGDGGLGDRRVGRGGLGARHLLLIRWRRLRTPVAHGDVP